MEKKEIARLSFEDFAEVVRKTALVSVDLVVRNSRDEILVGMRKNEPAKGYFFVPGGRILKKERISEAFERIAKNELGIEANFEGAGFLGVFEHIYSTNFTEKGDFGTHIIVLAYQLKVKEDSLYLPEEQHSEYKWLSKESMEKEARVHRYTKVYFDCHQRNTE